MLNFNIGLNKGKKIMIYFLDKARKCVMKKKSNDSKNLGQNPGKKLLNQLREKRKKIKETQGSGKTLKNKKV